jgi:DNA-binding SARP family transcriptional activator
VTLRIYLTGRAGVEADSELVVRERQFRGRQERVAFAYLVRERGRPVTREELAAVLWSDEPPSAWQAGLSAIVSRLRSLVARSELAQLAVSISRGFGQYRLFLPSDTWVDVEAAVHAIDEAEQRLRGDDPRSAFAPAVVASSIAQRPFLSGDDGGWVAQERQKLERVRLRALECLARVWLATDDPSLAVEAAAEALTLEPLRESSHRLLMQAHVAGGNPAEAVRAYHHLRGALVAELGTDPSRETEALYLQLIG